MLGQFTHHLRGAIDRWLLRPRARPVQEEAVDLERLQSTLQTELDVLAAWSQAARAKLEFLATTTHDAEVIGLVQTCPLRRTKEG